MPTLTVTTTSGRCPVVVEAGGLVTLGERVRAVAPADHAALLVDAAIRATHGEAARADLVEAGFDVLVHEIVAEERRKTIETAAAAWDALLAARHRRHAPVVALGGGITGDVAGFVAATWQRGVPLVHVPTTLLAMVDAAIGGKTAVNRPAPDGGLVKNLVGAFWAPRLVLADPCTLGTLDERHLRSGLAECVKHALLGDAGLLDVIESKREAILARDPDVLVELVARSAAVKIDLVSRDEREDGPRALLNLGHTFGHAIEATPGLGLHHGEAVAIGLVAAARCSAATGRLPAAEAETLERRIAGLGLPVRLTADVDVAALIERMGLDKKVRGAGLRLVLPVRGGGAVVVDDVARDDVETAWDAVRPSPAGTR